MRKTHNTCYKQQKRNRKRAIGTVIVTSVGVVAASCCTWLALSVALLPTADAKAAERVDVVDVVSKVSGIDDDGDVKPFDATRTMSLATCGANDGGSVAPLTDGTWSYVFDEIMSLRDAAVGIADDAVKDIGSEYVDDGDEEKLRSIEADMMCVTSKDEHDVLRERFDDIVNKCEKKRDDAKRVSDDGEDGTDTVADVDVDALNVPNGDRSGDASKVDDAAYGGRDASMDDVTWSGNQEYIDMLRGKVASVVDATGWVCTVDVDRCRCVVFRRNDTGGYDVALTANTQQGRIVDGKSITFTGVWHIEHKRRSLWADGIDVNDWWCCLVPCWQATNDDGHLWQDPSTGLFDGGQGFHRAWETEPGYSMGGCTGLTWDNAKFIYDEVPIGSTVVVF